MTAIGFHWPIVFEQGKYNPRTVLLAIPLPFPNSCARHAAVEAEKWNVARGVRRPRWLGPDLVASSDISETTETRDDQNHEGQASQMIEEPDEEDDYECIDVVDDEDEMQDGERNNDNRDFADERDFEEQTFKEIESASWGLGRSSIDSHRRLFEEVRERSEFRVDEGNGVLRALCAFRRAPEPIQLVSVLNAAILIARPS
jgi:hypothetical protein